MRLAKLIASFDAPLSSFPSCSPVSSGYDESHPCPPMTPTASTTRASLRKDSTADIRALLKKYAKQKDRIAVTASTGLAACNLGGVTLHSFAGIGLGIESAEDLATKIRKNKKSSSRWLRTKVLIIDEGLSSASPQNCMFGSDLTIFVVYSLVSMVDGELFDKLARIGSIMRKRTEPFGGIQVGHVLGLRHVHRYMLMRRPAAS